jgi:hypothetical protein
LGSTDSTVAVSLIPVQEARAKLLRKIRFMLVAMGVLMLVAYGFAFSTAKSDVKGAVEELAAQFQKRGTPVDPAQLKQIEAAAVWTQQWAAGVFLAVGVAYVVFGVLVFRWPVPITILALALYVISLAVIGLTDPQQLTSYPAIKVIIVVGLWRAFAAARSYERYVPVAAS